MLPITSRMGKIFSKFRAKKGWDKSPSLSIVFGLSSKTQWLNGLYYVDFISFYSPTQLCGGGTTKSNSNELPISVPLSLVLFAPTSFLLLLTIHSFLADQGDAPRSFSNSDRGAIDESFHGDHS